MTWAAPWSLASAHFASEPAVPISCRPSARAHWQAIRPDAAGRRVEEHEVTGLQATLRKRRRSRYCAVRPLSIMAAPVSKSIASGSLHTHLAGITRCSQ